MADVPNIPALSSRVDPEVRKAFDALKSWFNGKSGIPSTSDVSGLIEDAVGGITPDDLADTTVPPILTGFTATGAFNCIIVEWDDANYSNFGYVEVWRAEVDNLGVAVKIGQTISSLYTDIPPDTSTSVTYYYWGRIISKAGIAGPFNATAGTAASTANDPGYLLEILTGQLTESQLYTALQGRIDLIDDPTTGLIAKTAAAQAQIDSLSDQVSSLTMPVFDVNTAYNVGNNIRYEGNVYQCILATTVPSPLPTNATYWELVGAYAGDVAAQVAANAANAQTSADAAAQYASNAASSATSAGNSASSASLSATAAANSATTAGNSASAASTSANSASTSATNAGTYAVSASNSANTATTKAGEASTYAGQAAASATSASGYATSAATSLNQVQAIATGFDAAKAWNFDTGAEGWTAGNATIAVSGGALRITASTSDPIIMSASSLGINGGQDTLIRARVKRIAGTGWDGTAFYSTASHGASASYRKTVSNSTVLNEWRVVEWDMAALTAGGTDWTSNTILQIRLDLGASASDVFDIDWITIGRIAPQAYSAAIAEEATVRASETGDLFAQYTVKVDNNGYVSGFGLASTAVNGTPTSEFIVVADKFSIAPVASSPTASDGSPFYHLTAPATVNGVTVPAGTYMKAAYISDATITNAKIAALAVDSAKIANAAITTAKIADANITTAKIADAQITTAKIGDASVNTLKIAGNSVWITSYVDFGTVSATINSSGWTTLATTPALNHENASTIITYNIEGKTPSGDTGIVAEFRLARSDGTSIKVLGQTTYGSAFVLFLYGGSFTPPIAMPNGQSIVLQAKITAGPASATATAQGQLCISAGKR